MSPPLHRQSAAGLARETRAGDRSVTTVVEETLARIDARNDRTNAFVTVTAERARDAAAQAEQALADGEPVGPLHGVPIAIKDLDDVEGVRTTSGSLLFDDRIAERTDPFAQRLIDAGAIVVGKTNTPEFGLGCTTHNRVAGPTGTPFNPDYIAGGSSGGAAAALADGLVPLAQGSDTGGSIRTPASCCGVFGFKPTFGRVPIADTRDAYSHHTPFSHIGPLARTVEDAALMLDVMAGVHPADPFSLPTPTQSFTAAVHDPIDDLSIAYSPDLGVYPTADSVRTLVGEAVDAFDTAGATVERADPEFGLSNEDILDAYYTFATVLWEGLLDGLTEEGLDPRGGDRDKLTDSTVETILDAESVSTQALTAAQRVRTQVLRGMTDLFDEYDLLACPTLGVPPFEIGELPTEVAGESVEPRRGWLLTQPFNMTGQPVGTLPAGLTDDGLPVGFQLVGPRLAEDRVLAASGAYERVRPWRDRYPA
ncbi:amidase [Halosegnis rubeus]|uniref:Amidase n=1 Tax=Halosegnis rubeus TaxID=2212850 RepID=A0A5N5U9M0_9EURY|nr:amidase [Halosegnis rubeus]KAB7514362.1 amidase [Halosegnis rubeus]